MRGLFVPSFYKNMTFKNKVFEKLNLALANKQELFLIDLIITDTFKVIITLDGDNGVVLQDCIDISRFLDNNLEQDYSLEVASAGVSSPLKLTRQYKKNINRTLQVKLESEIIEAKLVDANDDFITLVWSARAPKKIGKGKETIQKTKEVTYAEIKEAVVIITF
jgi:ribosome maturation factor RimP